MLTTTFLTSGLSCFFLAVSAQASAPPHSLLRGEHQQRALLNNGNNHNNNHNIVGNDRDEQGCIRSAGYSWCASLSQCLRPFETTCPPVHDLVHPVHPVQPVQPVLPGGDVDQYGCRASAGETFCAYTRQCERPGACSGFLCPTVYEPVSCGGYRFSNLCEAEQAGYYPQQCTSIGAGPVDPGVGDYCGAVYEPVSCGGYRFSNLCEAEQAGYYPQQCTSIVY